MFGGVTVFLFLIACTDAEIPVTEPLESVAARSPDEIVELSVEFNSIQREPAIVEMLRGSGLRLESLRFKFVLGGGGEYSAKGKFGMGPYRSLEETFDEAEKEHGDFFRLLIAGGEKVEQIACPIDDSIMSVARRDSLPEEATLELACGLRIAALKLSGTAAAALEFRIQNLPIASVSRILSIEEQQRLLQYMQKVKD